MQAMSDVEMLCWRNQEQRRFAEEYSDREYLRKLDEWEETRRDEKLNMLRRWHRAAMVGAQVHLGISTVLALAGLQEWAMFGAVMTVFYYSCSLWLGGMTRG